ncbi:hypothetical protein CKO25_03045 [Thiocapsa imhoffii]|uniref:Tetratricopeptide repeat protein n=1 Tax=Thiocapsa imhoffii TaxID=382777 RepID=A0A9X0WFB4_9GAMM|nr:tetratricopeptide repeat protein [Thiocapsa imhoffii]MBK1643651.1 hypothetical protein [Thiocapsa imhoffii]
MPRLSLLQWFVFAVFLFFYGFTIFAATRDYYLRQLVRPIATAPATHSAAPSPGASTPRPPQNVAPQAITETNPALLAQQADELFVQRRYSEAVPLYRRLIELAPDQVDAYNDLGLALHYLGETNAALTQLRAGQAQDPTHQRILLTLGFVSLQADDASGARAALQQALDLGPETAMGEEAQRLLDLIPAD